MPVTVGDRVKFKDKLFLSDGFVKEIHSSDLLIIKLDKKAPNEYAYDTDEVISFGNDVEVIK